MLIRIALIVAIIGSLAAGALNFVTVKEKITTTLKDRDDARKTAADETAAHKKFEKLAKDTQVKLDATNSALVAMTGERDSAVSRADEQSKLAATLTDTLKKTTEERDGAQNELAAWRSIGVPIENIKSTIASLKTITEERDVIAAEKKVLLATNNKLIEELDIYKNPEHEVVLPAGLHGKVLVTDPKYDFVVLNIGENQGAKAFGNLIVNRNGKLVAKVQIRSVQSDRSIANVIPGWKLSDVMEGDQVLY